MKREVVPDLLADIARLLARYDAKDIQRAMKLLADPISTGRLLTLIEQALAARTKKPARKRASETIERKASTTTKTVQTKKSHSAKKRSIAKKRPTHERATKKVQDRKLRQPDRLPDHSGHDSQSDKIEGFSERLAAVKAARPNDGQLIDDVLGCASVTWTKGRVDRIANILSRAGLSPIVAKDSKRRRDQLLDFVEHAPRSALNDMIEIFQSQGSSRDGTLQEWSDIILRDRKVQT